MPLITSLNPEELKMGNGSGQSPPQRGEFAGKVTIFIDSTATV